MPELSSFSAQYTLAHQQKEQCLFSLSTAPRYSYYSGYLFVCMLPNYFTITFLPPTI